MESETQQTFRTYAWSYFSFHADQRMKTFNFFLISKRDLRQIATALGGATVLEGTVRRDGKHVRVSTELVDARNDNTIWADSYDRDLTDIFAIQSDIAQAVASKLSARLSPEEKQDIERKPTDDLEAYDLYLQAKESITKATLLSWYKDPRESLLHAVGFLEEATRKDSKFALAYCLLTKAHDWLYLWDLDKTPERRALGDAAVNQALHARPDLAEVHLAVSGSATKHRPVAPTPQPLG